MPHRVRVELIDDYDGKQSQERVRFGVNGRNERINLTTKQTVLLSVVESKVHGGGAGHHTPGEPRVDR